jgi:hypothetical protein
MADAEDALWQDLARLIDVSTEDVVKASLSGDFAAFEAIDFSALENAAPVTSSEPDPWDAPAAPVTIAPEIAPEIVEAPVPPPIVTRSAAEPAKKPVQKPTQPKNSRQQAIQPPLNPGNPGSYSVPQTPPQSSVPAFASASQSSPSPLVYPLRPLKKRQSLAMVELPDFKKQPSSPVPS